MEMKPKYDPREVEAGRYEEWVKNGYFKPSEDKSKETYTIVIPPPNVTGKLHFRTCMGYDFTRYHYTYETYARDTIRYTSRYGSCWYYDTGKGRS